MSPKNRKLIMLVLLGGPGLWTLWAPAQTLTPDPTTPFTFVSWGDSRDSTTGAPVNTPVLSALSIQARALYPAFTIFAGDLCDSFDTICAPPSDSTSSWKYAINDGSPGNGMFDITFPFRGNHDGDTALWDSYFTGHAEAAFTLMGGTPDAFHFSSYSGDSPERTYSFDFANSHIVGIDMPKGNISTMTRGQIAWLDSDLTNAESRGTKHTFILDHGPIYFVDSHHSKPSAALIKVMNSHPSIKATFHGHEHVMAAVHIDSAHIRGVTHPWEEFVTGAAGAPLYTCDPKRLSDNTATLWPYPDYCEGAPDGTNGFMSIEVLDDTSFTVSLYLQRSPSSVTLEWSRTFPPATP